MDDRGIHYIVEDGVNINRFAMIAAPVFAKLLHAENFPQSGRDASDFLRLFIGFCLHHRTGQSGWLRARQKPGDDVRGRVGVLAWP